jgi:hypothetical protein
MAPRLLTQSELSELVKTPVATDETPKVPVDPQTLRIGLGQGGLMGHGDEIEAFFKTLGGMKGDYEAERDAIRGDIAAAREAYPYRSLATELGGAGASAIGLGLLTGGLSIPATMGRGAAAARMAGLGAAEGAVYATGASEREGLRSLQDAPLGAALGGVGGAVGGTVVREATGLLGGLVDRVRRVRGDRASRAVEAEIQELANKSGTSVEEIIDAARRGMIPADISENLRRELGAYAQYISDPQRARMRERAVQARTGALGKTQQVLTGSTDENVLANISKGVDAAKKNASAAYDEAFDAAPKLKAPVRDSIQRALNDAPEALTELKKVLKGDLFTVGPRGLVKLNRVPTLREAEYIRRAIANKARSFYKSDMALAGERYDATEKVLRGLIDDASPDLAQTRAVWSQIQKNAEHFEAGRKVFGKSADEVEIAFEDISAAGGDALAAFRAGLADAMRRKGGQGSGVSLPNLLTNMDRKEAQIFRTIFPEDSYDEVVDMLDKARKSQLTAAELGQSRTQERTSRQQTRGMGNVATDVAEAVRYGNPMAIARLLRRLAGDLGGRFSDTQSRRVVELLLEENPDVIERALKDKGAYAAALSAANRVANTLRLAGTSAGSVAGSKAGVSLMEDLDSPR